LGVKSYFLGGLNDAMPAQKALCRRLPNWTDPWLLNDKDGDVIAYFSVVEVAVGVNAVQADISGRHFARDVEVIEVLRQLQSELGGSITDDDDRQVP